MARYIGVAGLSHMGIPKEVLRSENVIGIFPCILHAYEEFKCAYYMLRLSKETKSSE